MDEPTLYEGNEPYIFISYRHHDAERIFPVLAELRRRGYRLWFDRGIHAGESWTNALAQHIAGCAVFAPFLSAAFIESEYCLQETQYAKNKKRQIAPVRLDEAPLSDELEFLLQNKQQVSIEDFLRRLDKEPLFKLCRAEKSAAPVEILTRNPPMSPSTEFVGRGQIMRDIEARFRRGDSVVILQGMGGIGKSEICRKLYQGYIQGERTPPAPRLGWVMWNKSLPDTFYMQFRGIDETNITNHWNIVQTRMRELGPNLLLFLDNADNLNQSDAAELTRLGCRFLVTSRKIPRSERVRAINAGTLPDNECRLLYRIALYGESADDSPEPALDEIIRLAAAHTLTVRLLAKTQRAADMTAPEMLDKLHESGFDLSIPETVSYLHNPEYADADDNGERTFFEHMSRLFDLSALREPQNADALRALQGMSLLAPNAPIRKRTAKQWLGLENLNGLNRAAELGWLNEKMENGVPEISIHPVIAAVVRRNAPPDAETMDTIAGRLFKVLNDIRLNDMTPSSTNSLILLNAIELSKVMPNLAANIKMGNCLKLYVKTGAVLSIILGLIDFNNGNYAEALKHLEQARDIYLKLLGPEHLDTKSVQDYIDIIRSLLALLH